MNVYYIIEEVIKRLSRVTHRLNFGWKKMSDSTKLWAGISIIMISFFGGFFMMINGITSDSIGVGMILFYMMGIPMIGVLIGLPLILKGVGSGRRTPFNLFGAMASQIPEREESSYVYEPPSFCSECGASLSMDSVEWAGPLTVRCPYCGNTMKTEKRRI